MRVTKPALELATERAGRIAAEEANRLKDQFIAALSHELRAPVAAMLLWEKVLRDSTVTDALREQAIEAIHHSAIAQSRLVGDLLDVSRAISGKLYIDLRPVDLECVLGEALGAIAPAALAKNIAIARRGPRAAADILADDVRLRQVFDNLLSNAVKFSEPGGAVAVVVTSGERSIAIEITDDGRGIAPEFLPLLFEPFSQIDDLRVRGSGGLGLGLSITRQLIALHGGTIEATSPGLGCGSSFVVRFPIAGERRESPTTGARPPARLDQVHVLIVDDDPRVRDALALLLVRAGAVVETAASAAQARDQVSRHMPQVIVCDIAMPVEDGYSFIRRLRETGCFVPAVAVTAHARDVDVKHAVAAGFDAHFAKPIDVERLVTQLGTLVETAVS